MVLKIPLGIKMHKINLLFDSLEGAYAPNTIRSYRSDLIDQILNIMPLGVRNINTILLIFMKINLQTIF